MDGGDREDGAIAVKFFRAKAEIAMIEEVGFDDLLEGGFGVDAHGFDLVDLRHYHNT